MPSNWRVPLIIKWDGVGSLVFGAKLAKRSTRLKRSVCKNNDWEDDFFGVKVGEGRDV